MPVSFATILGSPICIENGYLVLTSCRTVCPDIAIEAISDFLVLLKLIASLIAFAKKYPISLFNEPRSDRELSFDSIKFFIFCLSGFDIFFVWKYSRVISLPTFINETSTAS